MLDFSGSGSYNINKMLCDRGCSVYLLSEKNCKTGLDCIASGDIADRLKLLEDSQFFLDRLNARYTHARTRLCHA